MRQARSITAMFRLISLFLMALALTLLPGCINSTPPQKPFSSEVYPSDPVAEIVEIRDRPVWVKYLNSKEETSASVGLTLKVGETIRTEASARVQILLKSGLVVRIEGDSTLTIDPKNSLKLSKGRMIARISADKNATAQIETPLATASISDTTVYLDVPKDKAKDRHIFAMQGNVEVLLNGASEPIKLKTGEDLTIKSNGIASLPKTLDPASIEKRLALNPLLYGFNRKLDSQAMIEANLQISEEVKNPVKVPAKRPQPSAYSAPASQPTRRPNSQPQKPQPAQNPASPTPDPQASPAPVEANQPPAATPVVAPIAPPPVQAEPVPIEPPPLPVQPEVGNPETVPKNP